jgi:SAM-dependent methyltransferase
VGTTPEQAADVWGEDDNARRYDAYARHYPNYRETSRDLIALALPSGDASVADAAVLDLACGTGATTREVLAVLGPDGRVTGVDQSAAMLAVAANSTIDPRVSWIQARTESVDQHVTGAVDAIVCNSAIWQTDLAATAKAARAVLKDGGPFAFNVPVDFLADRARDGSGDRYPALLSEMQAIAEQDYGWAPPDKPRGRTRQQLTHDSICRCMEAAGFDVELVIEVSHVGRAVGADLHQRSADGPVLRRAHARARQGLRARWPRPDRASTVGRLCLPGAQLGRNRAARRQLSQAHESGNSTNVSGLADR